MLPCDAVMQLMVMWTQKNRVKVAAEGQLEMSVPHKVHHQDNIAQHVDIQPEYGNLDRVQNKKQPDPVAKAWDDAVPPPVHDLIDRVHAILGHTDHDFRRVVNLVQFPKDWNGVLQPVIDVVG